MEGDNHEYKIAYFREFDYSAQCELHFFINTQLPVFGKLEEEIKAVRQRTDNVSSLLQHIKNKLIKICKDKFDIKHENEEPLKDIIVTLKRGNKSVKDDTVLNNFASSLKDRNVTLKVFDQKYTVTLNAPLVKQLQLPLILYANNTIQPTKFHAIFIEKQRSLFNWYKSTDKIDWESVGQGFSYSIKEEDLDHYLKLMCVPLNNMNIKGPTAEVISQHKVELMPSLPTCPFENRHEFTKQKLEKLKFRVVSYNILADKYASIINFPYCSPKTLAIDYRKQLIFKELLGYKADIICLQEVDDKHYKNFFKTKFRELGYGSFYHRKGNRIPEGLACIYNKSRFKLIESKHIVLSTEIPSQKVFMYLWNRIKNNEELKTIFLKQSTSLQVTVVKVKESNKHLIIGNTHLYYHPDADHIRLLQASMATTYLNMFKQKYQNIGDFSVIFCGDFNSGPDKSLFPYMIQGTTNPKHEDCLKIGGKIPLKHNFKFESSCGTPKYTNYTADFKGCLDYIFIEADKIQVQQVVPLTDEDELSKYEGLPNDVFPSDHLALVVDLKIK